MAEAITNIATLALLAAAIATLGAAISEVAKTVLRPIPIKADSRRRSGRS